MYDINILEEGGLGPLIVAPKMESFTPDCFRNVAKVVWTLTLDTVAEDHQACPLPGCLLEEDGAHEHDRVHLGPVCQGSPGSFLLLSASCLEQLKGLVWLPFGFYLCPLFLTASSALKCCSLPVLEPVIVGLAAIR